MLLMSFGIFFGFVRGKKKGRSPTEVSDLPFWTKKAPAFAGTHLCWHLPIFPARRHASIVGTTELNFCVRNGNRWTLCVNNTNFFVSLFDCQIRKQNAFKKFS